MYEAVILAAGYSSRMGTNKLRLLIDNKPMICHVVESFYPFCSKIIVVSGHYHEDVCALLSDYKKVHIVYNSDYHLGMFSSILCGIKQVTGDCFICPGDYPRITPDDIKPLTEAEGNFIVPVFEGNKGHPILIKQKLIEQLKQEATDSTLRHFRDKQEITYIEVNSSHILCDMDTPANYQTIEVRKELKIETT
jgi:molybdenum cofactor cytidylyltransferase